MLNGGHVNTTPGGAVVVPLIVLLLEDPLDMLNVGVLKLLVEEEVPNVGVLKVVVAEVLTVVLMLERELVEEVVVVEDPTEKVLVPQMLVSSHTCTVCGPALAEFGTVNEHPWDEGRVPPLATRQLPLVVCVDPSKLTITGTPVAVGLKPLPLITTLCPAVPAVGERVIEEVAKVTLNAAAKLITSKKRTRATTIEDLGRIKLAIPLQKDGCPRPEALPML
ncbi:MAG: hypothetical protein ACYCQJ_04960 [Nitrososphaerales archaeon]